MTYIDQILNLPYAVFWLPGAVFFAIAGSVYWLTHLRVHAEHAEVAAKDKPIVTASPAEQRVAFRRQGNPVPIHIAWPDDKTRPESGCVLDRSVGGMRLALFSELTPGTVVSIRPIRSENMVPWVDLEVRSCRPSAEHSDQFEAGCQYVKSPPYSIQLLFG